MTLMSENLTTSLLMVEQGSTPATPSAGDQKLFIRTSDHLLCYVNSSGTVTQVGGGMSNPMTTTGDIIYSSDGSGTPARLAAGTSGYVLTAGGAGVAPSWAAASGGALAGGVYNSGVGTDFSTTSTSYVDVTSATITLTTGAHRCLVVVAGTSYNSGNNLNTFTLMVDGTDVAAGAGGIVQSQFSGVAYNMSFSYVTAALTAASHTIKLRMKVSAGTGYWFKGASGNPEGHFSVVELAL